MQRWPLAAEGDQRLGRGVIGRQLLQHGGQSLGIASGNPMAVLPVPDRFRHGASDAGHHPEASRQSFSRHQAIALWPDRGGDQHIVLAIENRHHLHRQAWPHLHRR